MDALFDTPPTVWTNHNWLFHKDCMAVMENMPEGSVDLIVTDPPYRTSTGGDIDGANSVRPKGILSQNQELFKYQNNIKISQWMPELFRVLKDGSHCYVFTNAMNMRRMLNEAHKAGFKMHNILCWEKNNCTPSQYYMKNCEYVLFLRKGKAKYINNIGGSKTIHHFDNIIGGKLHPTQKPVPLLEFYIKNSSSPNDIVFDPFMGSGSTGVACMNTDRRFIGSELDDKYFDIASKRIGGEHS